MRNWCKSRARQLAGLAFLLLALAGMGWYFFHVCFDELDRIEIAGNNANRTYNVKNGESIEAEYNVQSALRKVTLWTDTKGGKAQGRLTAQLYSGEGTLIAEREVDYENLSEKDYSVIFPRLSYKMSPNETVRLKLTFEQEGSAALAIRTTAEKTLDLVLYGRIYTGDAATLQKGFFLLFLLLAAGLVLGYVFLFLLRAKLHWAFLVMAFFLLAAYDLVLPIKTVPDETSHYLQAYRLSDKLLSQTAEDEQIEFRNEDEFSLLKLPETPTRSTYIEIFRGLGEKATEEGTKLIKAFRFAWDGPTVWVSGAAITLGRALDLNGVTVYYMARWANSLLYLALCALAIFITPVRKGFFAVASLLPMALHLGSSVSYDVQMFPMAFLVAAIWLQMLCRPKEEPIKPWQWFAFCVPLLLLAPCKVYVFICFLALMLPSEKFKNRRTAYLFRFAAIAGALLFFIFLSGGAGQQYLAEPASGQYALSDIFSAPRDFVLLLLNTLRYYKGIYLSWMMGGTLGWLNISVDTFWLYALLLLLAAACLWTPEEDKLLPKKMNGYKIGLAAICLFTCAGIFYAAFAWTANTADMIQGVQGRYFLPLLPLVLILLRQKQLQPKRSLDSSLTFAAAFINVFVLLEIFTARLAA